MPAPKNAPASGTTFMNPSATRSTPAAPEASAMTFVRVRDPPPARAASIELPDRRLRGDSARSPRIESTMQSHAVMMPATAPMAAARARRGREAVG